MSERRAVRHLTDEHWRRVAFRPEQAALAANQPRTKVDVQLSAVSLALCEQQLRDAARLASIL